jgi:hypothetical protein
MRPFTAFLFLAAAVACFAQTPSVLESDPAGWKDIMPNASFDGWTRLAYLTTNPMDPVSQWKLDPAGRLLICEGNHGHELLRYNQEYADVIFHAEFRFVPIENGKGYNSGVIVRANADGTIWHQAQAGESGAGWLFANTPVNGQPQRIMLRTQLKEDRMKPAGQWNVYEVTAKGNKLSLWVNGGVTSEMPNLEVSKGFVGLEAEGYRVEFRNIKVKPL